MKITEKMLPILNIYIYIFKYIKNPYIYILKKWIQGKNHQGFIIFDYRRLLIFALPFWVRASTEITRSGRRAVKRNGKSAMLLVQAGNLAKGS